MYGLVYGLVYWLVHRWCVVILHIPMRVNFLGLCLYMVSDGMSVASRLGVSGGRSVTMHYLGVAVLACAWLSGMARSRTALAWLGGGAGLRAA